ncbi:HEAT repeat domain-containing protein [Bacillus alkalisoli]|uniref:HEAT repeat domain-containing protein n=1 Tax=Bacillus alkalisoli TaxID=2011008 RepID=UPI000C246F74|nr:HEAT repeat domain-containing protein [Bacillus alkalisoli]
MILPIQYVLFLMSIMVLILSALFVFLIVNKARSNQLTLQIERKKELLRDRFFLYLYEGEETTTIIPKDYKSFLALESLLHDFADVSAGEEMKWRIQQFAEEHFTPYYEKNIFRSRWAVRMNILYAIEKFQMTNMIEFVLKYLDKKILTKAEESQLLKILVTLNHPKLFAYLVNTKTSLSELVYRTLIGIMTDEQWDELVRKYDELPSEIKFPLLDMIGIQSKAEFVPFLEKCLLSTETEERIKALKSLAAIGFPMPFEKVESFVSSSIWEERLMAIKLMGISGENRVLPILEELMRDEQFDVRSQATQAILALENGKQYLFDVYLSTEDKYAKDMAAEWLEKEEQ